MTRAESAELRLDWRIYRRSLLGIAIALLVAAFSLGTPAAPLRSSLAPEAFDGQAAFSLLARMEASARRDRRHGSRGARLIAFIASHLEGLGASEAGGYALTTIHSQGSGALRSPPSVSLIAARPGSSSQPPILLLADLGAGRASASEAQLSGTAALLELAGVLSRAETVHPVDLVFARGAGAARSAVAALRAQDAQGRFAAAIVLGDLAPRRMRPPLVQPFSTAFGDAPQQLESTVASALGQQLHTNPGAPGVISQLAHFAFPMTTGEQGPLNADGIPTVSVQLSGERREGADEALSESHLQSAGSAVLSAFYALDQASSIESAPDVSLQIGAHTVPSWAVMLAALAMIIGPLLVSLDALVRFAGRGRRLSGHAIFVISCVLPFLACALVLMLLGAAGVIAAPADPVSAQALVFGAGAGVACALAFAAFLAAWRLPLAGGLMPVNLRDLLQAGFPRAAPATLLSIAFGCALALIVSAIDPYAALLLLLALHLWLPLACPASRPSRRSLRMLMALAPALPLLLLIVFYALNLRLGAAGTLSTGVMMIAGGYLSFGVVVLWSLGLGLLAATALAALPAALPAAPPMSQRDLQARQLTRTSLRGGVRVIPSRGDRAPSRGGAGGAGREPRRRHVRL